MSYVRDPKRHNVLDLLSGSGGSQFVIPVYQRNYVWEPTKQVKDLLNDLEKVLINPSQPHFIGIIIYLQSEGGALTDKKYYVIDGQQRLTTIFLILYAIFHISNEQDKQSLSDEILNYYLTNPYIKNDKLKMKLKPLMNDSYVYEKIALGKLESLTKIEKNSNVAKSYIFIRKYIEKLNKTYSLEEILSAINKLYLVDFPLGKNDSAHQIYESINAKGSKLLAVDLIRNFVLMNTKDEDKETLYEEKWHPIEDKFNDNAALENFFRFFLINRTKNFVAKNSVYDEFQKWFYSKSEMYGMREILDEIDRYSDYYLDVYYNDINDLNPKIRDIIREFRYISSDMPASFIMEAYSMIDSKEIKDYEFIEIVSIINSFIVRRAIIGLDTSGITRFFPTLLKKVYDLMSLEGVNFLEATKIVVINNNTGVASRMPTDSELKDNLLHINVYNYKDALKWVFDKIENHNNPMPISTKHLQIEHLLPQSNKKWIDLLGVTEDQYEYHLNRLGNLTLATQKDNVIMSNNLFEYKKAVLKESAHLRLNLEIINLNDWNVEEINKRTLYLIDKIIELYPYNASELENETLKQYKESNLPRMKELIDAGVINVGDVIYLTIDKNSSKAILLDESHVEFKGEKVKLNEWGQRVSGWKSIRIYAYIIVEGENKTLHEKRIEYMSNKNNDSIVFKGEINKRNINKIRSDFIQWMKQNYPEIERPDIMSSNVMLSINNDIGFSINDLINKKITLDKYENLYIEYFTQIERKSPSSHASVQKNNAKYFIEFYNNFYFKDSNE